MEIVGSGTIALLMIVAGILGLAWCFWCYTQGRLEYRKYGRTYFTVNKDTQPNIFFTWLILMLASCGIMILTGVYRLITGS